MDKERETQRKRKEKKERERGGKLQTVREYDILDGKTDIERKTKRERDRKDSQRGTENENKIKTEEETVVYRTI